MNDESWETYSVGDRLFKRRNTESCMSKPLLNVVTACSRPGNLPAINYYLKNLLPSFEVRWYVVFDSGKHTVPENVDGAFFVGGSPGVGYGAEQRNVALECIADGWVWCLDDDNVPHPAFDAELLRAVSSNPGAAGFVFGQFFGDVVIREARIENMRVSKVDMAQLVISRSAIGSTRFPANGSYEADWEFFEIIWKERHTDIGMRPPATWYNALTPRGQAVRGVPDAAVKRWQTAVHWRSYRELQDDIRKWSYHLPPISAVAGVPRSGIIPAAMLAVELHVPCVPIEAVLDGTPPYRPSKSRKLRIQDGPILILDDSMWTGDTMREIRSSLPQGRSDVILGSVYANAANLGVLDVAGYTFVSPHQSFAWNLFRDGNMNAMASDMDGVLCEDWHGPEEDEHATRYQQHVTSAEPLFVPRTPRGSQWKLRSIVTSRLHKHDAATRKWLARQGIEYGELVTAPYENAAERLAKEGFGKRKARIYTSLAKKGVKWFVESDSRQAAEIAGITGLPVIDFGSQQGLNCVPPEPLFPV